MQLTVLVDNNTLIDRYFIGEPGLSFYLEETDKRYLFDTGYSDVFLQNASRMDINLLDIDGVILSHGHNDHTWGLVPLVQHFSEALSERHFHKRPALFSCPEAFYPKRFGRLNIGGLLEKEQLQRIFDVTDVTAPVMLSNRLMLLGRIPRVIDFEADRAIGETLVDGVWVRDSLLDDTALVYQSDKGLVIITGCSHSGICNIVEYACKLCQVDSVYAIIGGFHLQHSKEEILEKTTDYLVGRKVEVMYPCHCTDLKAKMYLGKRLDVKEVGVGLKVTF